MNAELSSICPMCGGHRREGKTTFTADFGSGVVVVRAVEATICDQCGEEWIGNKVAQQLEAIVNQARDKHALVQVLTGS